MPICDGCDSQVDDAHIRRRIERLELATRFRPIHIQVLLIDAAPPARPEDYFYRAAKDRAVRSAPARRYFDELVKCVGALADSGMDEETALGEFQRRGYFLAGAIECPLENPAELPDVIRRAAPAILRRVEVSYKPKSLALLSQNMRELVPMFRANGWGDRLLLDEGGPFGDPLPTGLLARCLGLKAEA
ncbi:MAG TPA: hypothetical protein VJO53_13445 [Candidatus Acidoferrales bacterium]|nr:hypothetical protein [Candidatus Acidoferrales bacterium]